MLLCVVWLLTWTLVMASSLHQGYWLCFVSPQLFHEDGECWVYDEPLLKRIAQPRPWDDLPQIHTQCTHVNGQTTHTNTHASHNTGVFIRTHLHMTYFPSLRNDLNDWICTQLCVWWWTNVEWSQSGSKMKEKKKRLNHAAQCQGHRTFCTSVLCNNTCLYGLHNRACPRSRARDDDDDE